MNIDNVAAESHRGGQVDLIHEKVHCEIVIEIVTGGGATGGDALKAPYVIS